MAGLRSWTWRAIGIVFLVAVAIVALYEISVSYRLSPQRWPKVEFTSTEWKAMAPEKRYIFVNDLIQRRLLQGITKEKLIELLGKPSFEAPDGHYMTYIVKYAEPKEPSMNFIYLLHIEFNSERAVKNYFVRSD